MRYFDEKEKSSVAVRKARNGRGVFARRNFKKGETVFVVHGTLITCYEDDALDERTRDNTYRFNKDLYLSPAGTVGEYVNHSCEPNAKVVKRAGELSIVTLCPIAQGEEILFDYSTILASDDVWEMRCNCGTASCRGVVRQFRTLPKKLREAYLAAGAVPRHIR